MNKLTGHGRPSPRLVGEVGHHYEDIDTGDIYECRIASEFSPTHGWPVGGYVWERRAKGEDIREIYGSGGSGGSSVQPDWNQNDETAPDYVKNRPFWTSDPVEEIVVPLQNIEINDDYDVYEDGTVEVWLSGTDYPDDGGNGGIARSRFDDGNWFVVTFDGVEYKYVPGYTDDGYLMVYPESGENDRFEFALDYYGVDLGDDVFVDCCSPIFWINPSVVGAKHTVQIKHYGISRYQINARYIPHDDMKLDCYNPVASGSFSLGRLEGSSVGGYSVAVGDNVVASAACSHAEGGYTAVVGNTSTFPVYDWWDTFEPASGRDCHAEGYKSVATGHASHAEGLGTWVKSRACHAEGMYTIAGSDYQHTQGKFNVEDTKNTYAHIVGNGSNDARSNAHTLAWNGTATFAGAVTGTGADYAEYFEWVDGNPNHEDRIGLAVTLEGDKIRLANADDDILGIVTGTAMIIGDNAEWEWRQKYLVDDYGRVVTEMVEEFEGVINEETGEREKVSIGFVPRPTLNPDFDSAKDYIRRSDRPEWETIGMIGKIHVTDDGTCTVGGYAAVRSNGIVTASVEKTNMRVMKRIADNVVLVLMK